METNTYMVAGQTFELQHYGVKGMKWGHRKAREEYKKLDKAKREYKNAGKMYRRAAKTALKNDVLTAGNAYAARKLRDMYRKDYDSAKKAYKDQKKSVRKNAPVKAKLERGGKAVAGTLAKIGLAYTFDQTFNNGRGTDACKYALKGVGMLTISAVAKARGGYDIHWYDKQGRKIV